MITIAVGNIYADLLRLTLPRNARHFTEALVISSPGDNEVAEVVRSVSNARLFTTDAFTRHGARFNKGLGMTEGFEFMGKHGWLMILDADIILPTAIPWGIVRPNCLNGCRRRILEDASRFSDDLDWRTCRVNCDGGPVGYMQLFKCEDPVLKNKAYWYNPTFGHAGGSDAEFIGFWPSARRVVLPFDCLHLGPTAVNWFGTSQEGRDMMARFIYDHPWRDAQKKHTRESAARSPEPVHRVQVPGYESSTFELPFVARARRKP